MASCSGTSSGSTLPFTSGSSDGDDIKHQHQATTTTTAAVDQRRQKRMLSNRESARRSRMRKQKHLDDLTAEVSRLRVENERLLATYKSATQQYLAVEADNSVMRAQAGELATRLQSLGDILGYLDAVGVGGGDYVSPDDEAKPLAEAGSDGVMMMASPWIWNWSAQQQPVVGMATGAPPPMAADMLLY